MTDTRNMTLRNLTDYCEPSQPDSMLVTVPNGLLRELKELPTRDATEGAPSADLLRSWAKAYRDTPEHRFPSDPNAEFFPVDLERAADLLAATPQPAPDAMRETLAFFMAFFENMPAGMALTLTDLTALDRARARLEKEYPLSAPVPSPDGAGDLKELAHQLESMDWGDAPGPMRVLALKVCRAIHAIPPSATGAAEPDDQDPPMKWLIERLRGLAIELVADPKTPWIGERDPKQHICWTAADRLATPPVRGDREAIMKVVMSLSNINGMQAGALADAILSLPVQPDAGEREDELADLIEDHIDKNLGHDGRSIAQLVIRSRQPPQSNREG